MSAISAPMPSPDPPPIYRLTVQQYHKMIQNGIINEDDPVELIEGILVPKMGQNPPHALASQSLIDLLPPLLPGGWFLNVQAPVTTTESELEPDGAIIRGTRRQFTQQDRHPGPADMGLVIEVADTSLATDRGTKQRIYARASIPTFWIVNLVDRRVEVYTDPSGPGDDPVYRQQRDYQPGEEVPVVLDGNEVGRVRVNDLLP